MPYILTRRFWLPQLLLGALLPLVAAAQAPTPTPASKPVGRPAAKPAPTPVTPAGKPAAAPATSKPAATTKPTTAPATATPAAAKPAIIVATPAAQAAHYRAGKSQLGQGHPDAALRELEPLAQPAAHFAHGADAAYLAAVAHARLRHWADAEQLLNLVRTAYPTYPGLPEVLLLQGQVSFEQGDYDTAFKTLGLVPGGQLTAERDALKASYLPRLNDRATWQRLLRRAPDDAALARAYADRLAAPNGFGTEADRPQLEALIDKFQLDRARYAPALAPRPARPVARKASYNVAVLLPFEFDDPSWQKMRKTQFVTDLYAGLRLAQDSLQRAGKSVQLFAYDTGADTLKLKQVLALPELAGMDLLIGPVYKTGAKLLGRFAQENQIVCINPLSQDGDLVLDNPWHYLNSPSAATQGRLAAQFAADAFGAGRPAIVLQEDSHDDTAFADAYQATFEALGGKVSARRRFNPDADESLAAAGVGLDLAGASHVVVASDGRKVGPYFVGLQRAVPAANRPPLLVPAAWLDNPRLDPSQLNGPSVYFMQPKFSDEAALGARRFRQLYLQRQHVPPSTYASQGFDMLLFFGNALVQFGPAFQSGLATAGPEPGAVFQGYSYPTGTHDNQVMPITKLDRLDLRVVK